MFATNLHRVAGIIMLLLVVALVTALFTAETPQTDFDKFADDFQKIVDHETTYLIGQSVQVVVGVLVALLGAALYPLFRARDRFLALVGLSGFLVMAALFSASAGANLEVEQLASELHKGETFGDRTQVLEIARTVTSLGDNAFFFGIIFFGIGLLGFGAVIVLTSRTAGMTIPEPGLVEVTVAPPAWVGWLAVVAGVLYLLGWLVFVADAFFFLIIIAFFLTLIWYLTFGIWLLRTPAPPRIAQSG